MWTKLKEMVETPGVSGRESSIRELIMSYVEQSGFFDSVKADPLGNLICHRAASNRGDCRPRRILVAAHMDQTGFLISHIADDGTLRLHATGTCDLRTMGSQPVWVVSDKGSKLPGTIAVASKPVHTAEPTELNRTLSIQDFYVDLSLDPNSIKEEFALGDMVVFRGVFEEIGSSVVGPGLDDRIGCWAMLESLAHISNMRDDLYFVFTVQEELGSRGAAAVSRAIMPDMAIVCETVVSCDTPGVPIAEVVTVPGKGIAIQIADSSMISDPSLVRIAETAAGKANLATQRSVMTGGGQDGAIIQRSGQGVQTIALGCPLKFMHCAHEYAHQSDVRSYPRVIATVVDAV